MLISQVLPVMSIYHLPHGQYAYSGHILNLPQDVNSFVKNLPRSPSDLDVIIVRKEGAAESHKDFRVRRSVLLNALQWLVQNNLYYRNVTIDNTVLALLPVDTELTNLPTMTLTSTELENPAQDGEDPYCAHLGSTFIPLPVRGMTEQQAIQHSIDHTQHVNWSSTTGSPVNEFTTEGYISCAFPTLFPTGAGDFVVAPRQHSVTIGNYFKHLMLYHDQWFAKHPRFRYFALNTKMRHRALQADRQDLCTSEFS